LSSVQIPLKLKDTSKISFGNGLAAELQDFQSRPAAETGFWFGAGGASLLMVPAACRTGLSRRFEISRTNKYAGTRRAKACAQAGVDSHFKYWLLERSGTGIEGKPDAERLLSRGAFGPSQLLCYPRRGGFLFCHRLQLTHFGRRPSAPLL
jgi:hypothetical protein